MRLMIHWVYDRFEHMRICVSERFKKATIGMLSLLLPLCRDFMLTHLCLNGTHLSYLLDQLFSLLRVAGFFLFVLLF